MNIHVWAPDYASAIGGIQTFSRFTLRALRDLFPTSRIVVMSKNDTSFPDSSDDPTDSFTPFGWWHLKLRTAAFSAELFRRAASERPHLIIATHPNFAPLAYLLTKACRIPFVAIGHGVDVWEIPCRRLRNALAHASPLVAVSEFTRRRMAAAVSIPTSSVRILPNTFDPEKFFIGPKPRFLLKRYGLALEQPVILTISRLASAERYKGYDQVLLALPEVRKRFPDVRYVLGGRGPDRGRIEALIHELGVRENVILAGYVPEHELKEHYNLCDVFAMPSKGEGFGIVFLEAMACGKPVIAGNKDGSVDPLLNGKLGVLVDPDSVSEIAEALLQIFAKQHPLRILFDPHRLREEVIAAYGYERFAERLREILAPFAEAESRK